MPGGMVHSVLGKYYWMHTISEEKQVVLNIFKARIKMGLDLLIFEL